MTTVLTKALAVIGVNTKFKQKFFIQTNTISDFMQSLNLYLQSLLIEHLIFLDF